MEVKAVKPIHYVFSICPDAYQGRRVRVGDECGGHLLQRLIQDAGSSNHDKHCMPEMHAVFSL